MKKDEDRENILEQLVDGKITLSEASKQLDLIARQEKKRKRCEVSRKRAVSVYGLQSWPVTLYANQWLALSEFMPTILDFIDKNRDELSWSIGDLAPARRLDKEILDLYKLHGNNLPIPAVRMTKFMSYCRLEIAKGGDPESVVKDGIKKFRQF